MRLYLVQHGEAVAKEVDPERPLSDKGRGDAERLAEVLARRGVRVGRVLHSGKRRAAETAAALARSLAGEAAVARRDLDPNDATDAIAYEATGWDDDTLVVGHLPFMARLVGRLVAGHEDAGVVAFEPGSMVCLERSDGDWTIAWMLRPELLG